MSRNIWEFFLIAFQNLIYFSCHFSFVVKRFIVIPDRLNAGCVWVCLCLWAREEGCLFVCYLSEWDLLFSTLTWHSPLHCPTAQQTAWCFSSPSLQTKTLMVLILHFFCQPPFLFHVPPLLFPWPQLLRGLLKVAFFSYLLSQCQAQEALFYSYQLTCRYLKWAIL